MTSKKPAEPKKVALHLEKYVPGLLTWLSNKLAASASQAYRKHFGLGIVEWRILAYLAVYDWGTGAQMSQLMGMDKAAISRGASFLQAKKLIKSRAGFGRNLEFGLTAKGHEIHDRIMRLALAREDALLAGLSKKDISALISHLHVLLGNLSSVEALENREY
jgi:DNA-binding MarR family transcriptional regulator